VCAGITAGDWFGLPADRWGVFQQDPHPFGAPGPCSTFNAAQVPPQYKNSMDIDGATLTYAPHVWFNDFWLLRDYLVGRGLVLLCDAGCPGLGQGPMHGVCAG
jgi:hypothetical protein